MSAEHKLEYVRPNQYHLPPTGVKLAFGRLYPAARARLVELRSSFTQHDNYRVTGTGVCDYRCATRNPLKINSINDRNSYMPIYIAKKTSLYSNPIEMDERPSLLPEEDS